MKNSQLFLLCGSILFSGGVAGKDPIASVLLACIFFLGSIILND